MTCHWVNFLPVHAAGDYDIIAHEKPASTVMDNVMSSYTPSLKALSHARSRLTEMRQSLDSSIDNAYAFVAAMPQTPDHPPLDHAWPEAVAVQDSFSPNLHCKLVSSPDLDRKTVLEHLRTCMVAHFACHGVIDPQDPLRSTLLLQDWGPKPLRVAWLMRMELANCQLAYLSACQTAINADQDLSDESLHLSGAFQMAGVPCTVATVWEIADADAVDVAKRFYQDLSEQDGHVDISKSAKALHTALKELRDRHTSPFTWAGFVHFGA